MVMMICNDGDDDDDDDDDDLLPTDGCRERCGQRRGRYSAEEIGLRQKVLRDRK